MGFLTPPLVGAGLGPQFSCTHNGNDKLFTFNPWHQAQSLALSAQLAFMEEMNRHPVHRVVMKMQKDHGGSQYEFPRGVSDGCRMTGEPQGGCRDRRMGLGGWHHAQHGADAHEGLFKW